MKKKINLKNAIWKEGDNFVAWNLNTNVSSFGDSKKEALESLKEALKLYFEEVSIDEITKIERPDIISQSLSYA